MAYAFEPDDKSATAALRRLARSRTNAALTALDDPALSDDRRIHEMRKDIKKLRALLRLARPVFPAYADENAFLRDTARLISGQRDRDVLAATLDQLATDAALSPDDRAALPGQIGAGVPQADTAEALAEYRARMTAFAKRAARWKLGADGFDAVAPGLARSWTAARAAGRKAGKHPDAETLHTWRKRVKDHWYHARLLAPIWPEMMAPHIVAAGDLGETLGQHRDLALAADWLTAHPDLPAAASLLSAAVARQQALSKAARPLQTRLFAEAAPPLVARWGAWWQAWHD